MQRERHGMGGKDIGDWKGEEMKGRKEAESEGERGNWKKGVFHPNWCKVSHLQDKRNSKSPTVSLPVLCAAEIATDSK